MNYIHQSPVGIHGAVNIQNCLVDSRWIVKLTGFGMHKFLFGNPNSSIDEVWAGADVQLLFHLAPEILRLEHRSQSSHSTESFVSEAADIYGLGMVLFQVVNRLPLFYASEMTTDSKEKKTILKSTLCTKIFQTLWND